MTRPARGGIGYALAVLGLLFGCSAPETLPEEYLGRWYYTGSSGGIAGTGMGDEPSGYIVITEHNTIESYADDGTRTATSPFTPSLGPSIFGTEDVWLLDADSPVPRVIQVHDGTALSISENVYDGFSQHYVRIR